MVNAAQFTGPAAGEQFRPEPARPDMAPHSDMRSNTAPPAEPTEATSASVELKSEEVRVKRLQILRSGAPSVVILTSKLLDQPKLNLRLVVVCL